MDVLKTLQERRSIRAYKDTPVEEEKLLKVLEAARISPSAGNRQEWKFIVVRDKETIKKLSVAARNQHFVAEAPVVLVACGTEPEKVMACGQSAYTVDLSVAMSYMILEAAEQGLGTCWLGAFFEDQVKTVLDIPENIRVVAMTPMGYAAEKRGMTARKKLEEIICYEKYE